MDFDGTLADIVDDPAAARPHPGVPVLLGALAGHYATVAVISGRPLDFLVQVLGPPPGVALVGLYGLEWLDADGSRRRAPGADEWEPVVARATREAEGGAPEGVFVEPKGLTVTLHWRRAEHSESAARWVEEFTAAQAHRHGLERHRGRLSVELTPPLRVDKGTAVRAVAAGMRAVAALGDDLGDLAAFAALDELARSGVAVAKVAVTDPESPPAVAEAADVTVAGAAGAAELLAHLLAAVT